MNEPPLKPNREWPGSKELGSEPFREPPINRAKAVVRVILWILPTGFVALSGVALGSMPQFRQLGFGAWLVPDIIFILGAGWYNAFLSGRARHEHSGMVSKTLIFFFIQLFLIPLLLALSLFFVCVIKPMKF